jgi:hypothetical protein
VAGQTGRPATSRERQPIGARLAVAGRDLSERPWVRALVDEVPRLTPVWWALRGWLLAWVLARLTSSRTTRTGLYPFVPPVFGSAWIGLLVTVLAVLVSMREGRQNREAGGATGTRRWTRRGVTALCVMSAFALAGDIERYVPQYPMVIPATPICLNHAGDPITDVHPYDRDGRPLTDVHLYDQNGRPLVPCGVGTPSISALGPVPVPLTPIAPLAPGMPTEPPVASTAPTTTATTSTTGP